MDKRVKNLDYLDMLDLTMIISAGGRNICTTKNWGGEKQWNDSAKLYCPTVGRGWIAINGKVVALAPSRLYLVPMRREVSYGTASRIAIEWIHFHPQSPSLQRRLGSLVEVHAFSPAVSRRWRSVCKLMPEFLQRGSQNTVCRVHAMILEVVGIVLSGLPEENPRVRADHDRLLPALRYLEANAASRPSLREAARSVGLSPEHFHRLFREVFHTTPFQYAHARRMAQSRQLLSEGQFSVAEVASKCGYDDPFYFSRLFHRHFGVAPGRVRRGAAIGLSP